jgi:hypothetical protein
MQDEGIGIADPFASNRKYYLRGNGPAGAQPATDDIGTTPLSYAGAASAVGLSSGLTKWPGLYTTSMRCNTQGYRVTPTLGGLQNAAFRAAMNGSPFSMLMRVFIDGSAGSGYLRQIAQGTATWGGAGQILRMTHFPSGDGVNTRIDLSFAANKPDSDNRADMSSGVMPILSSWVEILFTRDASNVHRMYINGAKVSEATYTPLTASSITEQSVSTACDVGYGSVTPLYLNDDIFYDACIQTGASYTPATQPYA